MSEYITHIAVQEDTARLAIHSSEICDAFKLCFKEHLVASRMGSASRGNSTFIVQNLAYYRKIWEQRKLEDRLEDKLAYTLGWITHRAADRYFKPKYGIFDKNPENLHPVDIRIYHDAVLYEKVFKNGKLEPFSTGYAEKDMQSHPASKAVNVTKAEAIFGPFYQAEFLSFQSFDQCTDAESFIARANDQFAKFTVDFDRLIDAVNHPNKGEMKQMIEDPNFYNNSDPIIQIARNIQAGEPYDGTISQSLNTENQSQYAQTLSKSFKWIREASRFFMDENQNKEYLFNIFDIYEGQRIERY